jgi:uncharacterized membrane protein
VAISQLRECFKKANLESLEKILTLKAFKIELSWFLVGLAIGVYTITFSYFTIMKHYEFRSYAWDLGIFNQSFWTTLYEGRFFYNNVELLVNPSGSFFGIHFSPILFLILPIYAVYPTPQSLLIFQSFVLALGALPLFKLTLRVVKYRVVGLLFVFAYLLYPPLQGINWFDFHVQSFLPLFFFSAMYFLEKKDWKYYLLFVVLALMCEEHAALVVLFLGLSVAFQYKARIISALRNRNLRETPLLISGTTVVLSVAWYFMTVRIRNTFFPVNPAFLSSFQASSNWSVLGVADPMMIPLHIIFYPLQAILALSYDSLLKISYIVILFAPLAFRSFFKMRYLLPIVPWFFYGLFSNYQPYYVIFNQYPAYVISFIFVAAVYATYDSKTPSLKTLRKYLLMIALFSVLSFAFLSPLSPIVAMLSDSGLKPITPHNQLTHEILAYVPPNASIITHNNLFPHFSNRINAYAMPSIDPIISGKFAECANFTKEILGKVDYVLVDIKSDPFASSMVFSLMQEYYDFKVLVSADGVVLFKKGFQGNAIILAPYEARYEYSDLSLYSGEVIRVPNSSSSLVLHITGSNTSTPMFWYSPRSLLLPGEYNVTLRFRFSGIGEIFTVDICSNGGQTILASRIFFDSDSVNRDEWMSLTFHISLDEPLTDFEIRAINISNHADIYFDYFEIEQINSIAD